MINKKIGKSSFAFADPPVITTWASVAGKKEAEGPLGYSFDYTNADSYFNQKSWEDAEQEMQHIALEILCSKAKLDPKQLDLVLSGDLLNQCISSSFTLRNMDVPHLGLYGACSTMAESMLLASVMIGGHFADHVVAMTSSHFASSERQYLFPLNYGGQRPPTSQWTVTGAGAVLIQKNGKGPRISGCTIGAVVDQGIKDANNMGAAMAPAAYDTIKKHFQDFQCDSSSYDLIITGDLGQLGKDILLTLAQQDGLEIGGKVTDCGTLIYDCIKQDVHSGGSGCGCSAITLCGYFLDQLKSNKLNKVLFCGTGALLSPTSSQQGSAIPGICHAVVIEGAK